MGSLFLRSGLDVIYRSFTADFIFFSATRATVVRPARPSLQAAAPADKPKP
jgi:hypothetical protein